MSWVLILTLLVPLLDSLLKWLSGRTSLTTAQQKKLNQLIYKCNNIRHTACTMGCLPEGSPSDYEGGDIDPDVAASELIDAAMADAGFKMAGGKDIQEMKSKLSELFKWLRNAGLTWDRIFSFAQLVVPMIINGTIDWAALWEYVKKQFAAPPGPLSP